MSKYQISRNDFDALTLTEKLENFGSHFFDEEQMIVLHAVIQGRGNLSSMYWRTYEMMMDEESTYSMHEETFLFDWIVSEINGICEKAICQKTFAGRSWSAEYWINKSVLEDFLSFDSLVEAGLIEKLPEPGERQIKLLLSTIRELEEDLAQAEQKLAKSEEARKKLEEKLTHTEQTLAKTEKTFATREEARKRAIKTIRKLTNQVHTQSRELRKQQQQTERMNENRQTQAIKKTS